MELIEKFSLTSVSGHIPTRPASNLLGPLAILKGTWKGQGFNQIWRPFNVNSLPAGTVVPPGQDRFLELNQTLETLQFDEIPGDIPNRGFLQADITLHGLRYLQQVQDAVVLGSNGELAGIHVEPGIWVAVPPTTNPQDPTTVARLANIPHGTSLVAQGVALTPSSAAPTIAPISITPFTIGNPGSLVTFPESTLATPSAFRTDPGDIPNVTQAMVDNPNSVLGLGLLGKTVISTVQINISTSNTAVKTPTSGGGISNIAFLQGVTGAGGGPNAAAAQMDATFFIETLQEPDGTIKFQLQYSQRVLLNFNGLSWPHVSVATLIKQ